jgi:hypothetical protein
VQALGYETHPNWGYVGFGEGAYKEFGGFVCVTKVAPGETWTWHLSEAWVAPAIAFSHDGTKLAGTVKHGSAVKGFRGESIQIWIVPK